MKVFLICLLIVGLFAVGLVYAVYSYQSEPTNLFEDDGSFLYQGRQLGTTSEADADGDWISDRLEFWEYGTDPLKIDTDGDGIDDFNEIFTYPHLLNPLDPTDAKEFLALIPNVKAKTWGYYTGDTLATEAKFVVVGKRDPLVQWYAERTAIEWQNADHSWGLLKVNDEPLFLEFGRSGFPSPSYYLTHGRRGNCLEAHIAHYTILELMDYEGLYIFGRVEDGTGHAWIEMNINGELGELYVVDYNSVVPADEFYKTHNWTIDSKNDF